MNVSWARIYHLETRKSATLWPSTGSYSRRKQSIYTQHELSCKRRGQQRGVHSIRRAPTGRGRLTWQRDFDVTFAEKVVNLHRRCYTKRPSSHPSQSFPDESVSGDDVEDGASASAEPPRSQPDRRQGRPSEFQKDKGSLPSQAGEKAFFSTYEDVVLEDLLNSASQATMDRKDDETEAFSRGPMPTTGSSIRRKRHDARSAESQDGESRMQQLWEALEGSDAEEEGLITGDANEADDSILGNIADALDTPEAEGKAPLVYDSYELDALSVYEDREALEADSPNPKDQGTREREPSLLNDLDTGKIDYKAMLPQAIKDREPDRIARCLFAAKGRGDVIFLSSIPNETFSQIVRILEPTNWIGDLLELHADFDPMVLGYQWAHARIARSSEIAYQVSEMLLQVVDTRRRAGLDFGLDDYNVLLRSARTLGSLRLAWYTWTSLHSRDQKPDTDSYNHYMAAHVQRGMHRASTRRAERVIPYNMRQRKLQHKLVSYSNYNVGSGGILETVRQLFDEMQESGVKADLDSYCILITAAAREGRIDIVKATLQQIWSIDLDNPFKGPDAPQAKPLSEDSPLRPGPKLLWTIAHAFGINNDVAMGFHAVDVIARQYKVEMVKQVWDGLFESTFVLSTTRGGTDRTPEERPGRVRPATLEQVWNFMTVEPYSVKPTMRMYNRMIKSFYNRSMTPLMIEKMSEAIPIYLQHRREARHRFGVLERRSKSRADRRPIEAMRRGWELSDLIRQRDHYFVRRWMRLLLLSFDQWHRVDMAHKLWPCALPTVLWEWRFWAPTLVEYETPSAFIELQFRSEEEIAHSHRKHAAKWSVDGRQQKVKRAAPLFMGDDWAHGNTTPSSIEKAKKAKRREQMHEALQADE